MIGIVLAVWRRNFKKGREYMQQILRLCSSSRMQICPLTGSAKTLITNHLLLVFSVKWCSS